MTDRIPNNLRKFRNQAGLTQGDVALILGLGKRGADRILRWEKGYAFPNLQNVLKLGMLYNVLPEKIYEQLIKELRKKLQKRLKRKG